MRILLACLFVCWCLFPSAAEAQQRIAAERLLTHVEVLAHDSLQGRDAGTEGAAMARAYLREQLAGLDLQTFEGGLEQRFTFPHRRAEEEREGVNLMAYIEGQVVPDTFRAGGAGHLYSMGRAREGCKPSSFMRGIRGPSRCECACSHTSA